MIVIAKNTYNIIIVTYPYNDTYPRFALAFADLLDSSSNKTMQLRSK